MPPNAGLDLLSIVLCGFISLQLTGYDKSDNLEGILKSFIHFFGRDFLNAHFVPMVNDRDFTPPSAISQSVSLQVVTGRTVV